MNRSDFFKYQENGVIGKVVGQMILRSVKARFHTVYWNPPPYKIESPAIFVPNHHGWFDGYLMYCAAKKLNCPMIDWIEEYDAFPLFRYIGGMPFPKENPQERFKTVRNSIRWMQEHNKNLLLFAEGKLHRAPEVLTLGKSVEVVANRVPVKSIIPVAIVYEMGMHERPKAYIQFGEPIARQDLDLEQLRLKIESLIATTKNEIRNSSSFEVLQIGTKDVNERLGFNRKKRK